MKYILNNCTIENLCVSKELGNNDDIVEMNDCIIKQIAQSTSPFISETVESQIPLEGKESETDDHTEVNESNPGVVRVGDLINYVEDPLFEEVYVPWKKKKLSTMKAAAKAKMEFKDFYAKASSRLEMEKKGIEPFSIPRVMEYKPEEEEKKEDPEQIGDELFDIISSAGTKEMSKTSYRLLLYLFPRLVKEGEIHISQTEVSKEIGICQSMISAAIKDLVDNKVLDNGNFEGTCQNTYLSLHRYYGKQEHKPVENKLLFV